MARRERTHHLIELGGLVQKSGLVELTGDDRAMLYGAFLTLVDGLGGDEGEHVLALWRRRGKRAFEADQQARQQLQGDVGLGGEAAR